MLIIILSCKGLVIIEVKDTGIVMSQEDISKLFQEFIRIRNEKPKKLAEVVYDCLLSRNLFTNITMVLYM